MCKKISRFVLTYLLIISGFTAMLYFVYSLPNRYVSSNILESTDVLRQEGIYPTKFVNNYFFRLDNYTDFRMIDISISGDEDAPLVSAFLNYEDYGRGDMADGIDAMARGQKITEHTTYSRYWHLYVVFVKPLLLLFDYQGIRIFNYFLFFLSLGYLLFLINKKIGMDVAILFMVSMVPFNPFLIPMSMFFMICFMTMIVASICLLSCSGKMKQSNLYIIFFIIGSFISSVDLLSTPQITFVIPFILYELSKKSKNALSQLFFSGFSWVAGYAIVWASKFIIGYFVTGQNLFLDAFEVAQIRTSSTISTNSGNIDLSFATLFNRMSDFMTAHLFFALVVIIAIVISLIILYRIRKPWSIVKNNVYLLLIALAVPCWFIILRNHSFQHLFFTCRAWLATLFPILLFIYKSVAINNSTKLNS